MLETTSYLIRYVCEYDAFFCSCLARLWGACVCVCVRVSARVCVCVQSVDISRLCRRPGRDAAAPRVMKSSHTHTYSQTGARCSLDVLMHLFRPSVAACIVPCAAGHARSAMPLRKLWPIALCQPPALWSGNRNNRVNPRGSRQSVKGSESGGWIRERTRARVVTSPPRALSIAAPYAFLKNLPGRGPSISCQTVSFYTAVTRV